MALVQRTINQCDVCGYEWIPRSNGERCGNRECRSTKWNASAESGFRRPDSNDSATTERPQTISQLRQTIEEIEAKPVEVAARVEIAMCHKTWWEDGEQYECLMDQGHREQKHGMRGMVRRLDP